MTSPNEVQKLPEAGGTAKGLQFYMMERKTRPSFTWMGCKRHSVTLT
ncbi:hypothetical protein [Arachidicoccus soli]|nr:hypothetical protein [Arachidicoccus soli]